MQITPEGVTRQGMRSFGTTLIRFGAVGLAVPDPIPFVDEILFGTMIAAGAGLVAYSEWGPMPFGSPTSLPPIQSYPVTSTTGHSERRVKKQISSTSRSYYSRRKKYEYGKKRRY